MYHMSRFYFLDIDIHDSLYPILGEALVDKYI